MNKKLALYQALESVLSRRRLWKLGRYLYQGARRELVNHPDLNGEYALFDRAIPHWRASEGELLFLDVGANFADWSVKLLDRLGDIRSRARIIAFEPAPAQADRAQASIESAARGARVALERSAVGAESGLVTFDVTGEGTGNSGIATGAARGEAIEVPLLRLDDYPPIAGDAAIPLVKVDTEGNDFNVIRGAQALFDSQRIEMLQFEYNWRWLAFGHVLREVFEWMSGRGYTIGLLTQDAIELHAEWHPELDRFFETNFVIVRDDLIDRLGATRMRFGRDNVAEQL